MGTYQVTARPRVPKARVSRFVQIATAIGVDDYCLYALDEAGYVWSYVNNENGWRRLSERRLPPTSSQGET